MRLKFRTIVAPSMTAVSLSLVLAACGGGDGGAGGVPDAPAAPGTSTPTYHIGGSISGLASGNKLVLLDNGGDALTASADGAFSFRTPIAFNTAYAVAMATQPLWQWCSVANGSGTATADVSSVVVTCAGARAQVSTFAGKGTSTATAFKVPVGVAVDANGNVYVADNSGNQIDKIAPDGTVSTFAGSGVAGSANGSGLAASFYFPAGLAIDRSGNVYVADAGNNQIRKITPSGVVTTLAGSSMATGSADGAGTAATFVNPFGLAIDSNNNLYVADSGNNKIRRIDSNGVVTTLAGSGAIGSADGVGNSVTFNSPKGVAVDSNGNVFVGDQNNNEIRKITPGGVVTTFAGSTTAGAADLIGTAAGFQQPAGLAIDASNNLYVADSGNHKIRKIAPDGTVSTLAGSGSMSAIDGIGTAATFASPFGLALDAASGNVYVADPSSQQIRKIAPIQ